MFATGGLAGLSRRFGESINNRAAPMPVIRVGPVVEAGSLSQERSQSMPLGVVVRRLPGVTRWAKWVWQAVSVLPGAAPARWQVMRREGEAVEYHAATVSLDLYRTDTEAYLTALAEAVPCVYVVLRENSDPESDDPLEVVTVTASPFEGQDYADTGEEIVEKVPMPPGLAAWVQDFIDRHHEHEPFVKRRRDKKRVDLQESGIGDQRISQLSDVYRAPGGRRKGRLQ
ncbi:MAG: DUF3305 domain-containing protein [Burkholderiaceae bacterium]